MPWFWRVLPPPCLDGWESASRFKVGGWRRALASWEVEVRPNWVWLGVSLPFRCQRFRRWRVRIYRFIPWAVGIPRWTLRINYPFTMSKFVFDWYEALFLSYWSLDPNHLTYLFTFYLTSAASTKIHMPTPPMIGQAYPTPTIERSHSHRSWRVVVPSRPFDVWLDVLLMVCLVFLILHNRGPRDMPMLELYILYVGSQRRPVLVSFQGIHQGKLSHLCFWSEYKKFCP